MGRAGADSVAVGISPRRRVVVDVILLLTRNGRILLRERANTGYGDGAYEPPSGELTDRDTIVETAIRVALAAGIVIGAEDVSLAHVMHDVSGSGRIAFFLSASGWTGQPTSPDVGWFPVGDLPTNMLDRARVALRNCADGMHFSTYPAFLAGGTSGFPMASGSAQPVRPFGADESFGDESHESDGISEAQGPSSRNGRNGRGGRSTRNGSPARRKQACGRVLG